MALALQQRQQPTAVSEELLQIANDLGIVLEPLHPDAEDPYLFPCSGFHGEMSNSATAERVIARLNHCKPIETVYLKPLEEMA